jgi:hypothetical protein
MRIRSVISAGVYLVRLLLSLSVIWFTLGWNVRKTRKAFEKELTRQGMTKKNARRLSAQYSKLKNEMVSALKGSLFRRN